LKQGFIYYNLNPLIFLLKSLKTLNSELLKHLLINILINIFVFSEKQNQKSLDDINQEFKYEEYFHKLSKEEHADI